MDDPYRVAGKVAPLGDLALVIHRRGVELVRLTQREEGHLNPAHEAHIDPLDETGIRCRVRERNGRGGWKAPRSHHVVVATDGARTALGIAGVHRKPKNGDDEDLLHVLHR
jgi:hypothetical protein